MALSANTVWEVRTAGNDTNGGGFVTGAAGVDYSQQNGKRTGADVTNISTTDAVANGTTNIQSATANFDANIVGNIIYLQGGTGALTNVWRQVTARVDAQNITVDASVAAGTGITMNIGGALASLGMVGLSATVGGMVVHVKAGSYAIGSASNNISGGCFSQVATIHIFGYNTTRFDFGTRPVLTAGAINTFTVIATAGVVANIEIDCASRAASRGINSTINGSGAIYACKVSNATNNGFNNGSLSVAFLCEATGCSGQPAFSAFGYCWGCVAHDNTVTGFGGNGTRYVSCISESNSGASSDGFTSGSAMTIENCIAYNNGRDGYRFSAGGSQILDSIAESNVGTGINLGSLVGQMAVNCATFGNGTAITNTGVASFTQGAITGTSSFFTNAAGGDFTLNSNAGGGALVRSAGKLGTFPGTSTISVSSVGAAQSSSGGGGGGGVGFPILGGPWG